MEQVSITYFSAVDLGVDHWYANQLGDLEAISVERLSGHFILASITVRGVELWITVAFDHVSHALSNDMLCSTVEKEGPEADFAEGQAPEP
jgi:hypothetical protein